MKLENMRYSRMRRQAQERALSNVREAEITLVEGNQIVGRQAWDIVCYRGGYSEVRFFDQHGYRREVRIRMGRVR